MFRQYMSAKISFPALMAVVMLAAGLAWAPSAASDVIYDNVAVEGISLTDPDSGPSSAVLSGGVRQLADDFTLDSGTWLVTDVHWWDINFLDGGDPPELDFTIFFYNDDVGEPTGGPGDPSGTAFETRNVTVTGTDTGEGMFGSDILEYWVDIDPFELLGDTTYWIAIVLDDANQNWFWLADGGGTANAVTGLEDLSVDFWTTTGVAVDAAFQITGVQVPEPSTLSLFGIGLVGLGFMTRRRRSPRSSKTPRL